MESLKNKTIKSVFWNALGKFSSYGIEFIVGIFLARLLSPKEFGLIAMIMIVISISQVFINGGISQAIVRKQNCTQIDYSTAFYFNFIIGFFFYIILLITANPISNFFGNKDLKLIIEILSIVLVIGSLTIIQQAILIKRIDFKLQTKITIISSAFSGILAVIMAFKGYGVWSLVYKNISSQLISTLLLWYWNRWKPSLIFSFTSFKDLFGFGYKLLLSGLVGTIYTNASYAFIGKYFSAQDLGFYTRAESFKNLLSHNIESIATGVGYPVLATLQDDRLKMKDVFQKMFASTFFIVAMLMFGLALLAENLILVLIGDTWLPAVPLLQMFCFIGLMYPLNSMNINLMNVIGRSDLYLKYQTISQLFIIPNIIIGVYYGLNIFMIGMMFISLITYFLFAQETKYHIKYNLLEQWKDIRISLFIFILAALSLLSIRLLLNFRNTVIFLFINTGIYMILVISLSEIFNIKIYQFLKIEIFSLMKFHRN